ncbi:MAG TPA: hypothetical protein VHA82_11910 [Ramlibacter sp.]|uniref:hypothetical protein n=1 Tax=Ramlibacter sp. TaxID=1917967 RepID=UPI002C0AAFE1|nr:hypothetical protein [Ramlibacter sp.]HVZ44507.1 hypothetical protein [Ramlibacter sp.]
MFFSVFGGCWLALWAHGTFSAPLTAYALIGVATFVFFSIVLRTYRRHAPALNAEPDAQEQRRSRNFHIVNAAQWVLLLVVGNILANMRLSVWIIPAAIFIIGAHFVPLARIFEYPPHYITGTAMMSLAALYPLLASAGPGSPVGCLGAGIILWASAAWAIAPQRVRHDVT